MHRSTLLSWSECYSIVKVLCAACWYWQGKQPYCGCRMETSVALKYQVTLMLLSWYVKFTTSNSLCTYVHMYVCMYDNADSDIRWTNMKYSHSAHLLHHWQLLPCHCLQSLKIFVHTLDILNMNLRHFIGLVEIISLDCTFLFCHTNLALFINILFGWKVASTVWAVYAIVCYYYSVLILKQRCLTFMHDVYRAIQ